MLHNIIFFLSLLIVFGWWLVVKSQFKIIQLFYVIFISISIFFIAITLSLCLNFFHFQYLPNFLVVSSIEEGSRSFVYLTILGLKKFKFSTRYHQLKVAGISGVFFAVFENSGYLLNLSLGHFALRQFITTPLHIFLSIMHVKFYKKGIIYAWIVHTIYNLSYDLGTHIIQLVQILTVSSWIFIIMWIKKEKPKYFSAF